MDREQMVLKFYDFYCRKPKEYEFKNFMGEEALQEVYWDYGYKLNSYEQFLKDVFSGINTSGGRCYNVYDWSGNFLFHGTLDMIKEKYNQILDIPTMNGIHDIRRLNVSDDDEEARLLVSMRPYNRSNFIKFAYSNIGYEEGALPKNKVVLYRKKLLDKYGRRKRAFCEQKFEKAEYDDVIMNDYKRKVEVFMDMYCRMPGVKEFDFIGIDIDYLAKYDIKTARALAIVCGYKPTKGTKTFGVYDGNNEVFRGIKYDIANEYNLTEFVIRPGYKFEDSDGTKVEIKMIPFSTEDFDKELEKEKNNGNK